MIDITQLENQCHRLGRPVGLPSQIELRSRQSRYRAVPRGIDVGMGLHLTGSLFGSDRERIDPAPGNIHLKNRGMQQEFHAGFLAEIKGHILHHLRVKVLISIDIVALQSLAYLLVEAHDDRAALYGRSLLEPSDKRRRGGTPQEPVMFN